MKRLVFQFMVGSIFFFLVFTKAWGLINIISPQEMELSLPKINLDGSSSTSSEEMEVTSDPYAEDKGLELPESVLANLETIKFDTPELINAAIGQIEKDCKEYGIPIKKVLSVIKNFDAFLGANAGGLVGRGIGVPAQEKALIKILSNKDAFDFANMMAEITNNIIQNFGEDAFNGNELMNPNLTIQGYTLPLGNIARENPDVKNTNILLGALDFILNVKNPDNIEGINGYEIFNPYDGLAVALGNFAKSKEDWFKVYFKNNTGDSPLSGYQNLLSGFDEALGELGWSATVKDANEMMDFAELINTATIAYNNIISISSVPTGTILPPPTVIDFWKNILNIAAKKGQTDFRQITSIIRNMYNIED